MTVARCDFSDLAVDQCGCDRCRPDLAPIKPDFTVAHTFVAHYPGKCAKCGDPFHEGDQIGRTESGDYLCPGCVGGA